MKNRKIAFLQVYGIKLSLASVTTLVSKLQKIDTVRNWQKRIHVRCKVCVEYEDERKTLSKNGPIAF